MSPLARINVVPGWTMHHKTSRSCAASCRIYCALTKPPRSASRTSGSRPDSMNTIGLECLECRPLDAIALCTETVTIDKSSSNLAAFHAGNPERETSIKIRQVKYLNNIIEQD